MHNSRFSIRKDSDGDMGQGRHLLAITRRNRRDADGMRPGLSGGSFADEIPTPHRKSWDTEHTALGRGGCLDILGNASIQPYEHIGNMEITSFPRVGYHEVQALEVAEAHC